jgi:tetratricopeptide (TPR) repeat protein
LRENPAFRLDKPAVMLSAAAALTPRGVAEDQQTFLAALGPGLDAYRAGDFERAARLLDALSRTYPTAVEPPLYAGISLLMLNRPTEAVPKLESARALASGEFVAEVDWRLSLAYVHAGDPEKARPAFQRACSTANPYQGRACQALQALPPGP